MYSRAFFGCGDGYFTYDTHAVPLVAMHEKKEKVALPRSGLIHLCGKDRRMLRSINIWKRCTDV